VFPEPHPADAVVTVGQTGGDLRGQDQRVIQAAIEYVALLGGGVVRLLPGLYECANSVRLRSGVTLVGVGPGVVLRKSNGFETPLMLDADYGECCLSVDQPQHWQVGYGVCVSDSEAGGWHEMLATVTSVRDDQIWLDRPLEGRDLSVERAATARHSFPVITMIQIENAGLDNLVVEGNKVTNQRLNGCVGGAVYAYRCRNLHLKGLEVRDFNGDGVSIQATADLLMENCEVHGNTALGIHPGSGSQRPKIVGCHCHHNGEDGLFVCWRVRHGVFADNLIEANGRHGVSLGHKDTENLLEGNRIVGNAGHGVLFRPESADLAPHGCLLRRNIIENNGRRLPDGCGVRIEGAVRGLTLDGNIIRNTKGGKQAVGIWLGSETDEVSLNNNLVEGHREAEMRRQSAPEPPAEA
jgi:hypothetical protein